MNNNNKRQRLDGMNCDDVPENWAHQEKRELFFIKTAMLILTRMNLKEEYFCSFRAKEQKSLSRTNHFHSFYIVFFSLPKSCVWFLLMNDICACVCSVSRVRLFSNPWTAAHQTPLSMEFSRQDYWSRLLFLSPGDLLDPGTEHESPALADRFYTTEPPGKH